MSIPLRIIYLVPIGEYMFHISLANTKSENRTGKTKVLPFSIHFPYFQKQVVRLCLAVPARLEPGPLGKCLLQDFEVIRDKYQGASLAGGGEIP